MCVCGFSFSFLFPDMDLTVVLVVVAVILDFMLRNPRYRKGNGLGYVYSVFISALY